jgi:hypothetical protein
MRLAASQVIERPPAEVFRFVATDHFQLTAELLAVAD